MLKRTLLITALAVTIAPQGARTQESQAEYSRSAPPAAAQAPAPQLAVPAVQPATRQPQQFVNIKLDLTISVTDQRGVPVGPVKTATMYVVDRDNGRIRMGRAANSAPAPANVFEQPTPVLNVDATPEILSTGRVRVSVNFEYRPATRDSDNAEPIHVNERLSAVLEDGKPLVLSQTADPSSDRHVKVELKASIVR